MKNLFYIFLINNFLIIQIIAGNLKEIKKIILDSDQDKQRITSFNLMINNKLKNMNLLVFSHNSSHGYFQIFSNDYQTLNKIEIINKIYKNEFICHNENIYFFNNKLLSLNITNFKVDSISIFDKCYKSLKISSINSSELSVLNHSNYIEVYDFYSQKKLLKIDREKSVDWDNPLIVEGLIIYRNKDNELAAFDIENNKIKWKLNSGKQPGYFLGIKIGSFEDNFLCYKAYTENDKSFLTASTLISTLYKIDLLSGKVILKKEHFKGTGNNAGLIGNFTLIDMNKDGIKDLVGPSVDYNIYCIDSKDFSIIWEYNTGYENQMPLSFYDIDNDSIPEVFGVNDEMKLSIISGKSGGLINELFLQEGNKNDKYQTRVILADFTGNGILDIIVKGGYNELKILEMLKVKVQKNTILWNPVF